MKTFIKWAGNKSQCLKHIRPYLPDNYNVYFEPFIGFIFHFDEARVYQNTYLYWKKTIYIEENT